MFSTVLVSARASLSHASCTASSASLAEPSMRYATSRRWSRCSSKLTAKRYHARIDLRCSGMKKAKPKPKKKVVLLSGGNPQIAKGDGDAPVKAYIAAIPAGWKRDIAKRLDALIVKAVPNVTKAVKWN